MELSGDLRPLSGRREPYNSSLTDVHEFDGQLPDPCEICRLYTTDATEFRYLGFFFRAGLGGQHNHMNVTRVRLNAYGREHLDSIVFRQVQIEEDHARFGFPRPATVLGNERESSRQVETIGIHPARAGQDPIAVCAALDTWCARRRWWI